MKSLRIALLHFAPALGDLDGNRRRVAGAMRQAAKAGAQWVLTPELCLSGYQFQQPLGTTWIQPFPDPATVELMALAQELGLTLFLGHAERDRHTGQCHNTLFVLGPEGCVGFHRKIHVVPVAETWASAGSTLEPVELSACRVGLLICADAYTPPLANGLLARGAQVLLSAAAWSPFPHGPEGAWEARSRETGLPLLVCNRTGMDLSLDFTEAESGVYMDGRKCFGHRGTEALLVLDWDQEHQRICGTEVQPLKESVAL